jgi:hypothetical protein
MPLRRNIEQIRLIILGMSVATIIFELPNAAQRLARYARRMPDQAFRLPPRRHVERTARAWSLDGRPLL